MHSNRISLFISHAVNDPDWPDSAVLALADKFAKAGVDVQLDLLQERRLRRKLADADWRKWMDQALPQARYVLCLLSERYNDAWRRRNDGSRSGRGIAYECSYIGQWLYDEKGNTNGRVNLYLAESTEAPDGLRGQCAPYRRPRDEAKLVEYLSNPVDATRRDKHLRKLRELLDEEHTYLYVPLAGEQHGLDTAIVAFPQTIRPIVERHAVTGAQIPPTEHRDILEAIAAHTRALVLGDPGAGKTFAMLKVLEDDLAKGRLPLWVKLNHWLDDHLPFEKFVAREVPDLGADWSAVVRAGNCRLLLDGLNELPAERAKARRDAIATWLDQNPDCPVLLSCRETDLPSGEFGMLTERLLVRPLRPAQVRQFIANYMSRQPDAAEALFWRLAGGEVLRKAWDARPAAPTGNDARDEEALNALVEGTADCADWLDAAGKERCAKACGNPVREYPLATNPYTLMMLLAVLPHDQQRRFRQRADLFETFTGLCLVGELDKRGLSDSPDSVQTALAGLAADLQRLSEQVETGRDAAALALQWNDLAAEQRPPADIALGARLLRREGPLLRFRHQLLQEFYIALYLRDALAKGEDPLLEATWGRKPLWERGGWEQPFLLLADYRQAEIADLLRALVPIQPEVVGAVWEQTRRQRPELLTDALAGELRGTLQAQMLPPEPSADFPKREAAFGRGLGRMHLPDRRPLDRRRGVWGWYDARNKKAEVDIDWVTIPAGEFIYQGKQDRIGKPYQISRYPVTNSQFLVFLKDPQGWAIPDWWDGAPEDERRQEWSPRFAYTNHPCEQVSWWAAKAFCRWLNKCSGRSIDLPSEQQWERAAAGPDGRKYPWQGSWTDGYANAGSSIGATSAVGLFPAGRSEDGLHDLAGNVWEWTTDLFDPSDRGSVARAVRGGCWITRPEGCRAASRDGDLPGVRYSYLGFRVVCCPIPIPEP
jgi:formylglycine-generating enzyme required for sulfatase activity